MSLNYFLLREDNQTLFDLGHVPEWCNLLGDGELFLIRPHMAEYLGWELVFASPSWDKQYLFELGRKITEWANDHSFRFIDETHPVFGRWLNMFPDEPDWWQTRVTGTRFWEK